MSLYLFQWLIDSIIIHIFTSNNGNHPIILYNLQTDRFHLNANIWRKKKKCEYVISAERNLRSPAVQPQIKNVMCDSKNLLKMWNFDLKNLKTQQILCLQIFIFFFITCTQTRGDNTEKRFNKKSFSGHAAYSLHFVWLY